MGANDIRWVNADPNVGADNPNPPWGLTPKYPWLTIQFGVDQLAKIKGGQLNVMVGQYNENVDMRGAQYSNIKLTGQIAAPYTLDQPAEFCEERAVVDGGAKDSVFRIAQATGVLISNLNVQHGKAGLGAGLRIEEAQADIVACCIHDNEATGGGGGGFAYLACDKGQCRVERCLVWSNAARFNGAIAATGSGAGLGGTGGGGLIDGCTDLALEGNRFWDNVAQQQGGGALRIRGSHRVAIEAKGVFCRNKARPDGENPAEPAGGAILIDDCPDA